MDTADTVLAKGLTNRLRTAKCNFRIRCESSSVPCRCHADYFILHGSSLPVRRLFRCLLEFWRARIAVGTLIAERPPHRTVRAQFRHTAPTLGV